MQNAHKCKPSSPPPGMDEWTALAVRYEEAGLGNAMTDQTRHALASMRTFLLQPAEVYCPCRAAGSPVPEPRRGPMRKSDTRLAPLKADAYFLRRRWTTGGGSGESEIGGRLAAIGARAEAATPGPWHATAYGPLAPIVWESDDDGGIGCLRVCSSFNDDSRSQARVNAVFVAAAREDVPRLVETLQAIVALHVEGHSRHCQRCDEEWPCATVRVIEEGLQP